MQQSPNPVVYPAGKSHMPGMPTINEMVGVGAGVAIEVGVGVRSTTTRGVAAGSTLLSVRCGCAWVYRPPFEPRGLLPLAPTGRLVVYPAGKTQVLNPPRLVALHSWEYPQAGKV